MTDDLRAYTLPEAAERLGITQGQLMGLVEDGEIKLCNLGLRTKRVSQAELNRYSSVRPMGNTGDSIPRLKLPQNLYPSERNTSVRAGVVVKTYTPSVYAIKGADVVKIGKAVDVEARLIELARSSPVTLELIHVEYFDDRQAMNETEYLAHYLARGVRRHGEWFLCDERMAIRCLEAAARAVGHVHAEFPGLIGGYHV